MVRHFNYQINSELNIPGVYTLWCSGRTCCEGMLVELKLIRRQDLVAIISDLMKPSQDQLHIKIELSPDIMDPFVFCVGTKRTTLKFFKEMYDLVCIGCHDRFRLLS